MKYVLPLCLLLVACSKPLASSDFYGAMPELAETDLKTLIRELETD